MKSVRVVLAVVALLALPFGSVAAQGSSAANKCKNDPQAGRQGNSQAGAAAVAVAQANKCPTAPPPPPPPAPPPPPGGESPPTGIHSARGVVYEDVDGNGSRDLFAGEMGLAGWTVELHWNGQFVSSTTTDADGNYRFDNLGNSSTPWKVCVVPQSGYVRTQPANGDACDGNGVVHFLNSPFMTWLQTDFGEMIQ